MSFAATAVALLVATLVVITGFGVLTLGRTVPRAVVTGVIALAVAVTAVVGWYGQRAYLRDPYLRTGFEEPIDRVEAVLAHVHHARIAVRGGLPRGLSALRGRPLQPRRVAGRACDADTLCPSLHLSQLAARSEKRPLRVRRDSTTERPRAACRLLDAPLSWCSPASGVDAANPALRQALAMAGLRTHARPATQSTRRVREWRLPVARRRCHRKERRFGARPRSPPSETPHPAA